jgi:glucokinase
MADGVSVKASTEMRPSSPYALGIDLGGSSVKAVTVAPRGRILSRHNLEFDQGEPMHWAAKLREMVAQIQRERDRNATSVGLSAPGLAAQDGLSIAYMPGRLHGLEGLNWTQFLNAPSAVPVLNDAHAALLGETWLGSASGCTNVVMLTLGTGVGGAAMVDGRLLRGHIGRAGHLGHICLDPHGPVDITRIPGSLEWMIGNCSIQERSNGRFTSTHELIAAHQSGDGDATRVWLASVESLACAIASLINVLDPERVIIGGGIARAGADLFEPLQRFLDRIEWRPGGHQVEIFPAKLGEYAGAIGAASWGRHSANGRHKRG